MVDSWRFLQAYTMPFYEPRREPLRSCFAAEECPSARGEFKRCYSFPGYITFSMAKAYIEMCTRVDIRTTSDTQEDISAMGCEDRSTKAHTEMSTTETISDDISAVSDEDPSPQVWPDTDEEIDLGVNMGNAGNALTSTYFPKPCENLYMQPPGGAGADLAIIRKPVSWADMEDEVSIEMHSPGSHSTMTFPEPCQIMWSQPEASPAPTPGSQSSLAFPEPCQIMWSQREARAGHTPGSHSTMAFPEPCQTMWSQGEARAGHTPGSHSTMTFLEPCQNLLSQPEASSGHTPGSHSTTVFPKPCQALWSQPEASAECVSGGECTEASFANVAGYPGNVEASSRTQPLLLNLESALPTPLAPQGTSNPHAKSHPSSLWPTHLPHLLKMASAQLSKSPDTPHSCTSVSLQSTAATPFSRAFPLGSASSESETTTPQSRSKVTSFQMQEMPTGEGPTFSFGDSQSCLGASLPNRRVPVAVGPRDQSSKKPSNSKAPGASGPSMRSSMQEGKATGALALKKARSMLPAVNLKPSANPTTPSMQVASASPPSMSEGHVKSRTADAAQVVQRPFPTLLQGRRGEGMLKPKLKLSPGQVKPDEIGVAC